MGRIIAKRIRGMNWMAKVSLILVFILTDVLAYNIYLAYASIGNGQMVYNIETTTPEARTYTVSSNTFAAGVATVAGGTPSWVKVCAGTARNESVVAYVDTTNTLRILYWNGASWSNAAPHDWTAALGASGGSGRGFDIAVEKLSGDIIVAYTTNVAGTEINYRIWNGSAWTAAAGYDSGKLLDTGTVRFIKMESKPNSDDIALIMADTNNALSAAIWNGSTNAWGNPPAAALSISAAYINAGAVDAESFDLAYEGLSGDLLVAWADAGVSTGLYYKTFSAGAWGTTAQYANMNSAFDQVDCASDPVSDSIICAAAGRPNKNMRVGVWNGAAWQGTNTDVALDIANGSFLPGRKYLSVGWLTAGAIKKGIIVYNYKDMNVISWVVVNTDGTFTAQPDNTAATPMPQGGIAYYDIIMDPFNRDRLLFIFQDTANSDIFAKRLIMDTGGAFTWSDANGGVVITAAPTTPVASEAFHFAYDLRDNTPPTTSGLTFDSPVYTTYVGSPFTFHGNLADNESAVTACQVCVKNGAECISTDTWVAGTLSGSSPTWTCTATGATTYSNAGAITSGDNVYIDVRGTSTGGQNVDGGTAIFKTMDNTAPADGATFTITLGVDQNALSWAAATDAQSGLRTGSIYDVRFLAGTTPPSCSTGTSIYTGDLLTYTHTNLTPYIGGYSYRVCAYNNLNNASTGKTGTGLPTWSAITTSCGRCHAYPPFDGTARNNPAGAVVGDHQPHNYVCSTCHVVPATETSADYKHRDGNIRMKAGATAISGGYYDKNNNAAYDPGDDDTWLQTNSPTTATCRNIACHGGNNPTPQWGVGTVDCTGCHNAATSSPVAATLNAAVTTRRAIVPEFAATWSHKRSAAGAVTKYDCIVCHMEGDMSTGRTNSTYHMNGYIELRDPDLGTTIKGVTFSGTPGSYASTVTDARPVRFSRNLGSNAIEADTAAIQVNLCLKCHDAGGAASTAARVPGGTAEKPFATTIAGAGYTGAGVTANGVLGGVTDINESFKTTNSSYHPVSGKQNNWYAKLTRLQVPWNTATRGGTVDLTSWGDLISCWDCHAPVGATGVQTASVTAHGAAATLRGNATVLNGAVAPATGTNEATLCKICHALYDTNATADHGAGSAAQGLSMTEKVPFLRYGCNVCHSSGYSTPAARPVRAIDVHGVNALPPTGQILSGSWAAASPQGRPYAFIRNRSFLGNHSPASIGGAAATTPITCSMLGTDGAGVCSNQGSVGYTVGGTY